MTFLVYENAVIYSKSDWEKELTCHIVKSNRDTFYSQNRYKYNLFILPKVDMFGNKYI